MALKLTGTTSQQDPAWNFRFMLDKVKATEEYRKYKNRDFCEADFDYANRQEEHLVHIYEMMDDAYLEQCIDYYPRASQMAQKFFEKVLIQRTKKTMSPALFKKIIDNLSTWEHPTIGFNIGEYVLKQPDALTVIENIYQKFSHSPEMCALLDMLTSYWLLNGDDIIRDRAQKAILAFNLGDSLAVLAYAQKAGLVQKKEDQNMVFTDHFRRGNIHKESIRLLRKNKEEVKNHLDEKDPIFTKVYSYKYPEHRTQLLELEAWALAINLMYQKNPQKAQELFDQQVERWKGHLYHIQSIEEIQKDNYADWGSKCVIGDLLPIMVQAGPVFYKNTFIQQFLLMHLQWGVIPNIDMKTYTKCYVGLPSVFWTNADLEAKTLDNFINTCGIRQGYQTNTEAQKRVWTEVTKWFMNHRYDIKLPLFKTPSQAIIHEVLEKGCLLNTKEKKVWKQWIEEHPGDLGAHLFPIPHDQVGPSCQEVDLLF